jgi:hypothetical protein
MYERYEWECSKNGKNATLYGYVEPHPYIKNQARIGLGSVHLYVHPKTGTTYWISDKLFHPQKTTYHARKRGAMKASEIKYMEAMVLKPTKIPDLTNAEWSQETVGDHRFDVLRVRDKNGFHQVASVYESADPQFWAAVRGQGQLPLEGCNSFEEARAVCVALLRMGG